MRDFDTPTLPGEVVSFGRALLKRKLDIVGPGTQVTGNRDLAFVGRRYVAKTRPHQHVRQCGVQKYSRLEFQKPAGAVGSILGSWRCKTEPLSQIVTFWR